MHVYDDDDFDDQTFEKEFEPDLNRQKEEKVSSPPLVNVKSRFLAYTRPISVCGMAQGRGLFFVCSEYSSHAISL